MKSQLISVDEHEAVVDRDFLEQVGTALKGYASTDEEHWLADECIRIGNDYPREVEPDGG